MENKFSQLIARLIAGESLSADEIKQLKRLLVDQIHQEEFDEWLADNWISSEYNDVPVSYDKLKQGVIQYDKNTREGGATRRLLGRVALYYQQIAAVLLIPLLLGVVYVTLNRTSTDENIYTAEAPLGQKAKVELPDGSHVWLNSGSTISYSSDYNRKSRDINLKGEAFFDVAKNKQKPFFVHTQALDVEVTGTKFNLNAYNDESVTETSLVEGHVNLYFKRAGNQKYELEAGNVVAYSDSTQKISVRKLDQEAAIGWKDDRLIFINDDFVKLARKIERWYNMEVVFNPDDFQKNKLTVKLLRGEQLNKLLQIIESAIGAKCTVDGTKIFITKK